MTEQFSGDARTVEGLARILHDVAQSSGMTQVLPWEDLLDTDRLDYEGLAQAAATFLGVELGPAEPPLGSVILDSGAVAWQSGRVGDGVYWIPAALPRSRFEPGRSWDSLRSDLGPLTVIHAPDKYMREYGQ